MRHYTLTLNEGQARLISKATELLARLHMGQFDHLDFALNPAERFPDSLCYAMKAIMFPELDGPTFYSISNEKLPDEARVAYDLHRVIRHRLAWDNHPEGDKWQVDFDEPRQLGAEPLAEIQEVE